MTRLRTGRPHGRGLAPANSKAVSARGEVEVRVCLPVELCTALDARPEASRLAHVRLALAELDAHAAPPLAEVAWGPPWKPRLPLVLVERVEATYGVDRREAGIVTAVAAYVRRHGVRR